MYVPVRAELSIINFSPHPATHHPCGIAGNHRSLLVKRPMHATPCPDGGMRANVCAFRHNHIAAAPHIVAKHDGAVLVAPMSLVVNQPMLVGVHKCASPRREHIPAEGGRLMAHDKGTRPHIKMVAQRQCARLRHLYAAARPYGAFAQEIKPTSNVEYRAMIAEIGHLACVEANLHHAYPQLLGV